MIILENFFFFFLCQIIQVNFRVQPGISLDDFDDHAKKTELHPDFLISGCPEDLP